MVVIIMLDHNQQPESKRKEKMMTEKLRLEKQNPYDQSMELHLTIRHAQGIDVPVVLGRCYRALYWIEPDRVHNTPAVRTWYNNPTWDEDDSLPILNYTRCGVFLYVEIARLNSGTDPGPCTSSGVAIVGRARVPLPNQPCRQIARRFDLVTLDDRGNKSPAGHILLSMELKRMCLPALCRFYS